MRKLAADMGKYEMRAAYEKRRVTMIGGNTAVPLPITRADQACGDIGMNQDIQYETMYKEFIHGSGQGKINLLAQCDPAGAGRRNR